MTARRIQDEARLSIKIRDILNKLTSAGSALQTVEHVRSKIFEDADYKWAFVPEPVPLLAPAPRYWTSPNRWRSPRSGTSLHRYFVALLSWLVLWLLLRSPIDQAIWHLTLVLGIELAVVGVILKVGYDSLRCQEEDDVPFDHPPDSESLAEIIRREDPTDVVQKHLFGVSTLKPGWVRRVSLLVGLWVVAEYSRGEGSGPGTGDDRHHPLRPLGSAPWTDRLVFLRTTTAAGRVTSRGLHCARACGLTGIWSNTRDFPKTSRLFGDGAKDGSRFEALGTAAAAPYTVLVQRISAADDDTNPHQCRNPPWLCRRLQRDCNRRLAGAVWL